MSEGKALTPEALARWKERAGSGLMYRDDVLRLLAEVARLQGEVQRLREALHSKPIPSQHDCERCGNYGTHYEICENDPALASKEGEG